MCRGDEGLETKLFGLLHKSYVGVPGAFEAIRMEGECGAVPVDGEHAELDLIFGVADRVRLGRLMLGHCCFTQFYIGRMFLFDRPTPTASPRQGERG